MADIAAVVETYALAWNEADEARRRRTFESVWNKDGVYQDPTADVSGREALITHVAGFQQRYPGCHFEFVKGIDHHHGQFHFAWRMAGPDGETVLTGRDFGAVDAAGQICRITGFFDAPQQA